MDLYGCFTESEKPQNLAKTSTTGNTITHNKQEEIKKFKYFLSFKQTPQKTLEGRLQSEEEVN